MKLLESVRLVQFFLYEADEFKTGAVTGFFGMNGAGKSTLLDAVQIALFGGNGNLVSLNSKADDSSASVRTIRSYCLGQTTPDTASRVRDSATTYITLIWRDTVTGEPLSMGVCIGASYAKAGHDVLGRYLLPGIELAMADHLEVVDGQDRPAEWPVFRERLLKRPISGGEGPLAPDAERFIKRALFALRPKNAAIDEDAFKRALKFGLRMRFDKATVDDVIRRHVLESRPTDIEAFRKTSESFRELLRIFKEVREKIAEAEVIEVDYKKADSDFRKEVTWQALAKDVEAERCNDARNDAEERLQAAQEKLDEAKQKLEALGATKNGLIVEHQAVDAAMRSHKAHAIAGTANEKLTGAVQAFVRDYGSVSGQLRLLRSNAAQPLELVAQASNRTWLAEREPRTLLEPSVVKELASACKQLQDAQEQLGAAREQMQQAKDAASARRAAEEVRAAEETSIQAAANVMAALVPAEQALADAQVTAKTDLAERRQDLERAQQSLDRVNKGRAPLSDNVQRLEAALREAGLHPVPVCDLVKVKNSEWQPVIEAYLGLNREALMMSTAEEEAAAFDVYRKTRGIFGAKILGKLRQKPRDVPPDSVAALITGADQDAVAFVRSKLGSLKQAQTREEALGRNALTPDGMLDSGTEFERLRPVAQHELKLGGTTQTKEQRESLEARVRYCRRAVEDAEWLHKGLEDCLAAVRQLGGAEVFELRLKTEWERVLRATHDAVIGHQMLAESGDEGYQALVARERNLREQVDRAGAEETAVSKEVGGLETGVRTANAALERAKTDALAAAKVRDAARSAEGFDAQFASESWDALLNEFGSDYAKMAERCGKSADRRNESGNTALRAGLSKLEKFIPKFREHPPLDYATNWRAAWTWVQELLQRLRETELHKHEKEMWHAYEAARSAFRNDVAMKLGDNIKRMEKYLKTLNQALENCPPFTNGERYRFRHTVKAEYKALLHFVLNVQEGLVGDDLFGEPEEVPEVFKDLLEDKALANTAANENPLDDYRCFYEFDVEIRRVSGDDNADDPKRIIGVLSARLKSGSGGEHTAPLYVMAGAALSAAYRLQSAGPRDAGMALMLIDEAFLRMDDNNIAATMQYLIDLGLQVFVAGTGSNLPILTPFIHRYYDLARDEQNNTVLVSGHDVSKRARELAQSDLLEFHPELVEKELERLRALQGVAA